LISSHIITKNIFEKLDLILYILNRRARPQDILLKKYEIIQKLQTSEIMLSGVVDNSVVDQINNYIKKGPF
jgi:hypothetical protein